MDPLAVQVLNSKFHPTALARHPVQIQDSNHTHLLIVMTLGRAYQYKT